MDEGNSIVGDFRITPLCDGEIACFFFYKKFYALNCVKVFPPVAVIVQTYNPYALILHSITNSNTFDE